MHSMKYVQSKLFLSDCTKGATSSCFSFYTLVANKGIPANSHVLFVSLMHQGQFLLPNSQIWTNCFLTHDKGPFIIYRLGGLWGFFPAPSPHESLQTKVKYHDPPPPSLSNSSGSESDSESDDSGYNWPLNTTKLILVVVEEPRSSSYDHRCQSLPG